MKTNHTNLISETYTVQYDDKTLYGQLTGPDNFRALKLPLIIMAHGFNGTLEEYDTFTQLFASQGYLVYRFDFFGGSTRSKSGGQDMLEMSVLTELEDLSQVVDQLTTEPFVDSQHLLLMGTSQGGVVVSLYAAKHPDRLHRLILNFPAFVLFDDVKKTYQELNVETPTDIPEQVIHHNSRLGNIYLQDALKIDITDIQKRITTPTLLIQGTEDTIAPYHYALEACQRLSDAQLVTVESGKHRMDKIFMDHAIPAIEQFINQ